MRDGIATTWVRPSRKTLVRGSEVRSDLYRRSVVVKSAWNRGRGAVAVTPFGKKENQDGRRRALAMCSYLRRFRRDRRDCKAIPTLPFHGRSNGWLDAWVCLEYENASEYISGVSPQVHIVRCYVYGINFDSKERRVCGHDVWDHCDPGSSVPVCS
jgi:hypothetical protein